MQVLTAVVVILLFSAVDTVFGLVLYIQGNKLPLFGQDVSHYNFTKAMFEFWLFSLARTVLLVGAALGVVSNPSDGRKRIKASRYVVGTVDVFMVVYAITKMLLYSEYVDGNHDLDPWFWSLFVWTVVASFCMYGLWVYVLQEVRPATRIKDREFAVLVDECDQSSTSSESESTGSGGDDDADDDDEDSYDDDDDKDDEGDDVSETSTNCKRKRTKEKKKVPKGSSALWRLLTYSKPDWPYLLVGFTALVCASGGEVFIPLYTGKVIDGIVVVGDRSQFNQSIMMITILSIVIAIGNGVRGGCLSMAMARLNFRITNLLFGSIVKQEVGFFDKTRTGAITSRLTSDVSTMSNTLALNMNICLRSMMQGVGYTVFMIILSWRLTVFTLISFPILGIIADIYGSYYEKLAKKVQTSLAKANIIAEETISTMKTVRSFANERGEQKNYRDKLTITYLFRRKEALAYGSYTILTDTFELLVFVVTLFYGGHLVIGELMTGGTLVAFILYQLELANCLEEISEVYTSLMKASGASRKVFQLIDREPEINNEGKLAPAEFKGHLEFRNVQFAYPTRPGIPILKDVSFAASPGEVIALVGPSGGGKSSCISLMEHFYEPASGEVLLDGVNVKDYNHSYLHNKIALVGQEPVLYAGSIQDNISYSLDDCSEERMHEAAKLANAHNFILQLKKGYQTETGEKGLQLSGGQKQRVAIARALVRNPQLLLLDESTSALDAESEHLVQQALYDKYRNRTIVIVAHRLSTIEKADRIVVIDHGKVVEQGRHQELIRADGLYAKLVQRQLLGLDQSDDECEGGKPNTKRHKVPNNKAIRVRQSSESSVEMSPKFSR